MASMLVSLNETTNFISPNHQQPPRTSTNFMGKLPYLNSNPNPSPNPNFIVNNNNGNHFSRKQLNPLHHLNGDDFPAPAIEDSTSFNHHRKASIDAGGGAGMSLAHHVSIDITNMSKSDIRSLKTRLMSELERVRSLNNRIESGDFRNVSSSNNVNNINHISKKRPFPTVQPLVKEPKRGKLQQPAYVASPQVMKMCAQVLSKVMKQKGGYVFNEPVDVIGMGLHDYHQIVKRPMDLGTIKKNLGGKGYRTPDDFAADVRLTFNNALMYNPKGHEVHILAERLLEKFEQYFRPVSQKFQLEKQQYLRQQKVETRPRENVVVVLDEVQGSSWSKNPSPEPARVESPPKKSDPRPEERFETVPTWAKPKIEPPRPRSEPMMEPSRPKSEPRAEPPPPPPPPKPEAVPEPAAQVPLQDAVRAMAVGTTERRSRLPKPKAKDPNKREMTMEEKHKLGGGLQSLPEDRMNQVIQIIRKRNGHLTQDGDEIELDIEAVDTETLWELDRFVTNFKKAESKTRRQALMEMQNRNAGRRDDHNQAGVGERVMETAKAVKRGGGDVGDEDVDIGDEMPVHNFPPVEIDKDDDRNHGGGGDTSSSSSSSSSGSDSSSSSDSDSGSSSGSDSDVDDAQSRDNESKNIPH